MPVALEVLIAIVLLCPAAMGAEKAVSDSCVECHRNRDFLVTNPKLYDYFQKWNESVHKHEGLSCVDCHGGNSKSADKDVAHGGKLGAEDATSAVNFRNIPQTCGDCHPDIYEGFRKSKHFEHVIAKGQDAQGPSCVTCHGSMNAAVVHVDAVESTCTKCHNTETKNRPETAQEAGDLLYQFLSIQRFYRYITVRGTAADTKTFLKDADAKIHALSKTWHTFDIAKIRTETRSVLNSLSAKRQEVGRAYKQKQGTGKK